MILENYWTDVYKTGHKSMLPKGSFRMVSNFTPRSGKLSNIPNNGKILNVGNQIVFQDLIEDWDKNFFKLNFKEFEVKIKQFQYDMTQMLMLSEEFDVSHFRALYKLGYLPLEIKAIDEGEEIPYKIPMYVLYNTQEIGQDIFDWVVNYLETALSMESWHTPTSATTALAMRRLGSYWAERTNPEMQWFVDYQFHDFSMRGMSGKSAAKHSGLGFAMVSKGSDTLPVIPLARKYYDVPNDEVVINSVIATEHAIMCTLTGFFILTKDGEWEKVGNMELETFRYLLELYPSGILSVVSDTWDLWRVVTEYCKELKDLIMSRNGKLVIRPDSGDPVKIVCGIPDNDFGGKNTIGLKQLGWTNIVEQQKGVVELLWEVFGGTKTSTGYKQLDSHIGVIYGDSINYQRAEDIFTRLEAKGFASTNIVLGVGSYSLQYVTRDTHGFAQKATYVEVEVDNKIESINIFKDPITDDGVKKSIKGLPLVYKENGEYKLKDQVSWEEFIGESNLLRTIVKDGKFTRRFTFKEIRTKLGLI